MDINLLKIWTELAVNQYHVNPSIFVFLMVLSLPPYYWGWYGLAKEGVDFRKRFKDKRHHLGISDILKERNFLLPLGVNRAAWVMPYIYVIGWGKNIPNWFWILFFGWIALSSFLFWNKLKEEIQKNSQNSRT